MGRGQGAKTRSVPCTLGSPAPTALSHGLTLTLRCPQEKGTTPLHVAAKAGQILQAELLVVYGADPGAPDVNGRTPIDYARWVLATGRVGNPACQAGTAAPLSVLAPGGR